MTDGFRACTRERKSLDDNLIPLINVVFLMLIFFLIAGQIRASEPIGFQLPDSLESFAAEDISSEIVVHVFGANAYLLNGESFSEGALSAALQRLASDIETISILTLKADAQLDAEKLQTTLVLIKKSGFKSVELLVERVSHVD